MKLFYEHHEIGQIVIERDRPPAFVYDRGWLASEESFPVSTVMPLTAEAYDWAVLAPWLLNLLPENDEHLKRMARNVHVPPTDVLALLGKVGHDTSGAVSFAESGSTTDDVIPVDSADLERMIEELPLKPFLAGDEGVSMCLAGVQTKLAVRCLDGGRVAIPINGSASTHILKPGTTRLYGGVHNEALCITLAALCGIKAPKVATGTAGSRPYLLVERYTTGQSKATSCAGPIKKISAKLSHCLQVPNTSTIKLADGR